MINKLQRLVRPSTLLAHAVEEDYEPRPAGSRYLGAVASPVMPVDARFYDPGDIPSYELLEEQYGRERRAPAPLPPLPPLPERPEKLLLKKLGLKFLNARQHFLLAACRDVSLIPCAVGLFQLWKFLLDGGSGAVTSARLLEHFLTGLWCVVAGYLLYSVLDGLMVRWIVTYATTAAIVRMLSMLVILMAVEQMLVAALSAQGYKYGLHTWILISCLLTMLYIAQNFITSNIDLKGKRRARFFDFYAIVVFAVVPVGMASFVTMLGLLRCLLILRLDIEQMQ